MERIIAGMTAAQWQAEYPIVEQLVRMEETLWQNPKRQPIEAARASCPLTLSDIEDAAARLARFAPYFCKVFPETRATGGLLESPLVEIPRMKASFDAALPGRLLVKLDSQLPVSGSIKARGGIYEVLKTAEDIAAAHGMLPEDYADFASEDMRRLLSGYSVAVGSTGNLGLSIGIMSAKLGFSATVHMSADARQWKKDMLRAKGVRVIEYASDYSAAVAQGRREAQNDPTCHFVDDENSQTLFLGYAVAALRLRDQLRAQGIVVDAAHPLCVYLPCGVGGGPGGVAFGLRQVFGDAVHCWFAEPTHACCMLLGMATGAHNALCVQDFGIDNRTIADGLAVGRASGFVGRLMEPFIDGCYTLTDAHMSRLLAQLDASEGIRLEPSALAGMAGPATLRARGLLPANMEQGTHIVWATGGGMVPPEEMERYVEAGRRLLGKNL